MTKLSEAYQGKPGAYSHMACIKAFPNCLTIPCETFEEVFQKTNLKETDISLIPFASANSARATP